MVVTNHPDSGTQGNDWALDNYTATLHLNGAGVVSNTLCPGIGSFTGSSATSSRAPSPNQGHFTTQVGQAVPGTGSLNGSPAPTIGTAVTGGMHGTLPYVFYANVPLSAFSASNAPASDDGSLPGPHPHMGTWPEQYAPAGTQFWDSNGATAGAEYLGTSPDVQLLLHRCPRQRPGLPERERPLDRLLRTDQQQRLRSRGRQHPRTRRGALLTASPNFRQACRFGLCGGRWPGLHRRAEGPASGSGAGSGPACSTASSPAPALTSHPSVTPQIRMFRVAEVGSGVGGFSLTPRRSTPAAAAADNDRP